MRVRDDCETLSTRETNNSEDRPENPVDGGVLAALPRTRPQRVSPRRAAARQRAGKTEPETGSPAPAQSAPKTTTSPKTARKTTPTQTTPRKATPTQTNLGKATPTQTARETTPAVPAAEKATPSKTKIKAKTQTTSAKAKTTSAKKPAEPPAPKQGYEPEEEVELGKTVNPPNGVELVESVADIFGELASSGLAAGGRILKDAFSLLRRP